MKWLPIEQIPKEFKDGREVDLWCVWPDQGSDGKRAHEGRSAASTWHNGEWVLGGKYDSPGSFPQSAYVYPPKITHFMAVTPPDSQT